MMSIKWSEQAKRGWNEVASYILQDFGLGGLKLFKQRTKESESYISKFPNGCEILWTDPETEIVYHKCAIYGRSIMLYFVYDNTIIIADFWDVRSHH